MHDDRAPLPPFDAVSLDVGGVLIMPDRRMVSRALTRADVRHDAARFFDGHYRAMAAIDRCRPQPEEFTDYARGFLRAVGAAEDQLEAGEAALASVLRLSSAWSQRIRGAVAAGRRIAAAGLPLAVTSNSDGTVTERMRRHRVVQSARVRACPSSTSPIPGCWASPNPIPRCSSRPPQACRCLPSASATSATAAATTPTVQRRWEWSRCTSTPSACAGVITTTSSRSPTSLTARSRRAA